MDRYSDPAFVMRLRPGILPTEQQELLLRAIFFEDEDAWERWTRTLNLNELDHSTERLIPLLHPKLARFKIAGPLRAKIEEIYGQTRLKNRVMFLDLFRVLASFQQAAIDTMVLKGGALIPQYYRDPGLRPMVDLDVLVRTQHAVRSIDLLKKMGFEPLAEKDVHFSERLVPLIHGYAFYRPSTSRVDLHWHVLPECLRETDDDDFWNDSIPVSIERINLRSLNSADQILHVCVHGSKWAPSIHWVPDTMVILNSETKINWNRLVEQANKRRLMLPVRHALTYLRENFRAAVPAEVLEALVPPSKREFAEFQYKTENHFQKTLGNLPLLWYSYLRSTNSKKANLFGFTGFLQQFWGLKSRWLIPLQMIKRLVRKRVRLVPAKAGRRKQ
jgi:Uncharacterised nucleotidyltransferase